MFSRRCCGRKVIAVSLMFSKNEVAELSEAELIRQVHLQLGTPGSKMLDPKDP